MTTVIIINEANNTKTDEVDIQRSSRDKLMNVQKRSNLLLYALLYVLDTSKKWSSDIETNCAYSR